MLGRIYSDKAEAVLGDDGRWTSTVPMLESLLNAQYALDDYHESDGQPGAKQVGAAAKALGFDAEFADTHEEGSEPLTPEQIAALGKETMDALVKEWTEHVGKPQA